MRWYLDIDEIRGNVVRSIKSLYNQYNVIGGTFFIFDEANTYCLTDVFDRLSIYTCFRLINTNQ